MDGFNIEYKSDGIGNNTNNNDNKEYKYPTFWQSYGSLIIGVCIFVVVYLLLAILLPRQKLIRSRELVSWSRPSLIETPIYRPMGGVTPQIQLKNRWKPQNLSPIYE